jgi:hypothetical protein
VRIAPKGEGKSKNDKTSAHDGKLALILHYCKDDKKNAERHAEVTESLWTMDDTICAKAFNDSAKDGLFRRILAGTNVLYFIAFRFSTNGRPER